MSGLWEEVGQIALVKLDLADNAALEQGFATGVESSVQKSEEDNGISVQNLARLVVQRTENVDALENGSGVGGVVGLGLGSELDLGGHCGGLDAILEALRRCKMVKVDGS